MLREFHRLALSQMDQARCELFIGAFFFAILKKNQAKKVKSNSSFKVNEYILCSADESLKNKLGFYVIEVKKEQTLVALFKGVAYRTTK